MPLVPIEDTFKFTHDSNTQGVIRAHLVGIGEMARSLQYTNALYDTKAKAIILTKGAVRSDPLPAHDSFVLSIIYRILWFEVQTEHNGLSGQLVERLQEQDNQIKRLKEQVAVLNRRLDIPDDVSIDGSTDPAVTHDDPHAAHGVVTTLTPLAIAPHQSKEPDNLAAADPESTIRHLRQQAMNMDGYITVKGQYSYYRRPKVLKPNTAFDPEWENDGLRFIFLVPNELQKMHLFVTHDQDLIAQQCVRSSVAS